MNSPFQQHGAFSWCELMTTDPLAAKEFYAKLFGWTMKDEPMEGMTYTVVKVNEQEIGGIMPVNAPQIQGTPPPHWGIYVTVDDVDAAAKLAEKLGAKIIVQPTDIPNVGRFSVIQDPQGAVMSIITYIN